MLINNIFNYIELSVSLCLYSIETGCDRVHADRRIYISLCFRYYEADSEY